MSNSNSIKNILFALEQKKNKPLPRQASIAPLGTFHRGWSSLTVHRFTASDCLLQTTKGRMPLITSQTRMLPFQGEGGWTAYPPYLDGSAETLRSSRFSVNSCCLNAEQGSFSQSKSHRSLGTLQALLPMGEPVHGRESCPLDRSHWPYAMGAGPHLTCLGRLPTPCLGRRSLLFPLALCLCVGGSHAWKWGVQKNGRSSGHQEKHAVLWTQSQWPCETGMITQE